jgi:hypothetical protein
MMLSPRTRRPVVRTETNSTYTNASVRNRVFHRGNYSIVSNNGGHPRGQNASIGAVELGCLKFRIFYVELPAFV